MKKLILVIATIGSLTACDKSDYIKPHMDFSGVDIDLGLSCPRLKITTDSTHVVYESKNIIVQE